MSAPAPPPADRAAEAVVAAAARMPGRWRLLAVAIALFTASAIGLFAVIVDRHMKLQQSGDSIANAALRTAMEFQDLQTAVRIFAAAPTGENRDRVRLTYDILYSRLDVMTVGAYGAIFTEAEPVGQLIRSLKPQVIAMAPLVDRLKPERPVDAVALLEAVMPLERPIALFGTGSTQLQAKRNDAARAQLVALYGGLGALFAGVVGSIGAFVWLLIRQFRQISASNGELRRLSAQLADAKLDADMANQAKSHFLAVMSHELRTPLNAILGFSEIIAAELFGPVGERRYKGYAQDINRSGAHLLSLVNDVLDLSRIEAGRYELREEPLSLAAVIDSCIVLVRPTAKPGTSLTHGSLDGLPSVVADGRAVRQMLLNLLSNAVKFTPAGGVVHAGATRAADGGVILRVRDTGIGMSPEDTDKALIAFNHVNSQVAREQKGAGLGLSITKRLIELHGGSLSIRSGRGEGTEVTLSFPPERVRSGAGRGCLAA